MGTGFASGGHAARFEVPGGGVGVAPPVGAIQFDRVAVKTPLPSPMDQVPSSPESVTTSSISNSPSGPSASIVMF